MPNNPPGDQLVHASIALGVVATIAVILRFIARSKSKADFGSDDTLIAICLIPQWAMIIINFQVVHKGGFGLPIATLSPSQVSFILKLIMCALSTYTLTITMVKISILLLYRRIFETAAFRKKTLVVGILCITWFFIAIFLEIFQCHPQSAAFDPEMLFTDHCIAMQSYLEGVTATNMGIDVIMLLLPAHMVWRLKLPVKQRIALSGIFMLGGLACFAGIMRLVKLGVLEEEDISVSLVAEYIWTEVEAATAIICACMVTYRPLFVNISQSLSKASSLFSKGSLVSKRATQDDWNDLEEATASQLQWPTGNTSIKGTDGAVDGLCLVQVRQLPAQA